MGAGTSTDNCAAYKQYGGQSASQAGLKGAALGLGGLVGLGGFWQATDSGPLTKITQDFDNLKLALTNMENSYKGRLTQSQEDFSETQFQLMEEIEEFHEDMLDDKIQKNTLLLTILFASLIIIIIYLAVL